MEGAPSIVARRLRDAASVHASQLAGRTTLESSLRSVDDVADFAIDGAPAVSVGGDAEDGVHPLAKLALPRSSCPQPPLDDGITGGGSSVSVDVHLTAMDVRLDPLERCAPDRIVVPQHEDEGGLVRGEADGAHGGILGEQRSATWNAITALATLCEEVEELETVFYSQILPSIVLFSAEDDAIPNRVEAKKDILDEEAQQRRESALLARMGRFLPALTVASNGTARLRRLVKNMVVQLGAVQTPSAVPFYYNDRPSEEGGSKDQNGSSASEKENAATAPKRVGEETMQPPVFGQGVPMYRLGKAIAVALRILVAVDRAVASNAELQEAWAMYKDVVMEHGEEKRNDGALDPEFASFERMMGQLDFGLLSSRSFVSAIEQNFDPRGRFRAAKFPLYDELKAIILTLYAQSCERINTDEETTERKDCVGIYALYVLYRHLLPPNVVPDAKLHKTLWTVYPAMCPIMELYGPLPFLPREFMMTHAPYKAVKGCSADVTEIRSEAAAATLKWNASFPARVAQIRLEALGWIARADSELSPTVPEHHRTVSEEDDEDAEELALASSIASIEVATSCVLQGLAIAHSASILLRSQLLAHRALGLNYDPKHLQPLMSLMEVLKSIEKMLRVRRRAAVLAVQRSTLKMIASNILKRFEGVRGFVDQCSSSMDFTSERARSITRVGACLTALEGVLKGSSSFSPIRRHSVAFSIAACMDTTILGVFAPEDLQAVEMHLQSLTRIASIEETLGRVCDCSFVYFYRDLLPAFVRSLYQTSLKSTANRTQLVLSAFSDPERILKHVRHVERSPESGTTACSDGYKGFVFRVLKEEYIHPLCEAIETDLRLATSGTKGVDGCLRNFILAPPLYVCQIKLDVKDEVELYLEKTIYDLCALNLDDCNTYTVMRTIAAERFDLNLTDPLLPDGFHNQGVDFVDLLRDLGPFASKYNYNLVEQAFVERRPEPGARFIITFGIDCVAASFKQHGFGIASSAVNACYQLLAKKFQLFTELLADDRVKSLLSRELRWFNNQKSEGHGFYPFDRASAFAQELKQVQTPSGNNALDECRAIITEMGNVIALARTIRASKRKVFCNQRPFLSSIAAPRDADSTSQNPVTTDVDDVIASILQTADSDVVRAYVNVFRGVIQQSQSDSASLGTFYCIIPSLCLCSMEASIQGKEILHKSNITRDGFFTDDGFALGLAFALSVLDQSQSYESLNWFKSIQYKYATDEEDLTEKKKAHEVKRNAKIAASKQSSWFSSGAEDKTKEEDEELTVLTLSEKRLEGNRREMAMLFFSVHSAQSFFKEIRSSTTNQ